MNINPISSINNNINSIPNNNKITPSFKAIPEIKRIGKPGLFERMRHEILSDSQIVEKFTKIFSKTGKNITARNVKILNNLLHELNNPELLSTLMKVENRKGLIFTPHINTDCPDKILDMMDSEARYNICKRNSPLLHDQNKDEKWFETVLMSEKINPDELCAAILPIKDKIAENVNEYFVVKEVLEQLEALRRPDLINKILKDETVLNFAKMRQDKILFLVKMEDKYGDDPTYPFTCAIPPDSSRYSYTTINEGRKRAQSSKNCYIKVLEAMLGKKSLNDTETLNLLLKFEIGDNVNKAFLTPTRFDGNSLLFSFADIRPEDVDPELYHTVLSNLKTLDINYNVSDYMGVPFVEHIMNSENEYLLNLVSDFTFDWIPEFDHAYERITTPEFKEKVKNLNIRFRDIEESIEFESREAFSKVAAQSKSPLFNPRRLAKKIAEAKDPEFRTYVIQEFSKYCSKS